MSHADFFDSSSSFEPPRHAALRLGFLRQSADTGAVDALGRIHVDKIGGLPSWPYPPPQQAMQAPGCPACDKRMPFVLSVVPPLGLAAERQDCLHVFVCHDSACARATNAVRVFRSQRPLPAADQDAMVPPGCMPSLILREKALDFEDYSDDDGLLEGEEHIEQLIQNYKKECKEDLGQNEAGGEDGGDAGDDNVPDTKADKIHLAFTRRIAAAPSQVVRYYSSGPDTVGPMETEEFKVGPMDNMKTDALSEPLWVCERGRMAGQVPPCAECSGKRRLEMQVMPQILNFVEVLDQSADGSGAGKGGGSGGGKYGTFQLQMDMDWGTIAVYMCDARCDLLADSTGSGFCEEFAWRQVSFCPVNFIVCIVVCFVLGSLREVRKVGQRKIVALLCLAALPLNRTKDPRSVHVEGNAGSHALPRAFARQGARQVEGL